MQAVAGNALTGVIEQTIGIAAKQRGYIGHNAILYVLFVRKCECTPNILKIEHRAKTWAKKSAAPIGTAIQCG
ncbi:hypothetical protein HVA01_02310 [Halovibrio variabilis]|uniref:Uncharacterized protein n=1 Tax=Halovibrio variabilis TaxID=31910 RepID=A0A511UJ27_9GAMM|nr:hypothetical protein HVA01_02310 [Halovibrio variabilis]